MGNCYNRIQTCTVQLVDLYIFRESSTMDAFLKSEKNRLGIATSSFEESFLATHDTWQGIPRIMIASDKMSNLSELMSVGTVRHETAHTILHGSPEYYIFSTPTALKKLGEQHNIPNQTLRDILYLISIAVKDYEVTNLLYEKGYREDQIAYTKYFLNPSEEDMLAWNVTQTNLIAKFLVLASIMKTACCAAPLLKDKQYGNELAEYVLRSMNYLPSELSSRIIKTLRTLSFLNHSTHKNIEFFAKKFVDDLCVLLI